MLFRPLFYTASQIINFLLQKYKKMSLYLVFSAHSRFRDSSEGGGWGMKAGANYLAMANFNDFLLFLFLFLSTLFIGEYHR